MADPPLREFLSFFPYTGRVGRVEIVWRPGGSAMPASPVTPNGPSTPSHPTKTGHLGQTGQGHAAQANQGALAGHIGQVGPRQLTAGGLQGQPGKEPKHSILNGRR